MKKIIYLILVIGLGLVLNSCDSTTSSSDDKVTYSGVVRLIDLEGNESTSGDVSVAVFIKDYDDIAWDYRLEKPVIVTNTNDSGEFLYKATDNSRYVVYFLMEGYSIKEFEQKELIENVVLYENIEISGVFHEPLLLDGKSDVVVTDDVIFLDTSDLICLGYSRFRIEVGKKIVVYGGINFGERSIISSNDNSYSYNNEQIENFNSFEIMPSCEIINNRFNSIKVFNSDNGIIINNQNEIKIQDIYFLNSNSGLSITYSENINIENFNGKNVAYASSAGIYAIFSSNINIYNSKFINCSNGVIMQEVSLFDAAHNFYENNDTGFFCYNSLGEIKNSDFSHSSIYDLNIRNLDILGTLKVEYNNFYSSTAINQHSLRGTYYEQNIGYNNFIQNDVFIRYVSNKVYKNIDARFNYFNGLSLYTQIMDKIVKIEHPNDYNIEVIIEPFYINPLQDAGVAHE